MSANSHIPVFPWPHPAVSASDVLDRSLVNSAKKLYDIDSRLVSALRNVAYTGKNYYYVLNGSALVTQIEQIRQDDTALQPPDRWSAKVKRDQINWKDYLSPLFFPKPGYFKIIESNM